MSKKAVIRLGDPTDHGGSVISAFTDFKYQGVPLAGVGHMVACPKCKGVFPIIEGTEKLTYAGTKVALKGVKTACGASLIASQQKYTIDINSITSIPKRKFPPYLTGEKEPSGYIPDYPRLRNTHDLPDPSLRQLLEMCFASPGTAQAFVADKSFCTKK